MNNIEIITERFVLRNLSKDDISLKYLKWIRGENASPYIYYDGETYKQLQDYVYEKSIRENILFLGVFLKNSLQHIGNIKYEPVDVEKKYAELGILIGEPKWQGVGAGPEVIRASAKWLQKEKGIKQIILGVDVANESAIKAYKKVGFTEEDTPYAFKEEDTPYAFKEEGILLSMVWDIL